MPPHIYTIADAALCSIVEEATNQSIIISGESGAGKTEAVKKCLQYISIVAGNDNDEDKIEERILSSNPVLEAFGNAKTLRNNNSSRFGKFMQIHFDPTAKILGCSNTSYLLEKSRVVFQDQGERNFHIFYLLCKGASDDMLKELKMKRDPNNYKYINQSGCMDVDGINDTSWYKEVLECFTSLGLNYEKETMAILRVVASILLLGNVSFAEDLNDSENSVIKETGASLDDIAALLGVHCARSLILCSQLLRVRHLPLLFACNLVAECTLIARSNSSHNLDRLSSTPESHNLDRLGETHSRTQHRI